MSLMAKPGLAAVEIGHRIGASAQEVNRLFFEQGFLEKINNAWSVTQKGAEYGIQVARSSSDLPQAKSWDVTYWRDGVLDVLDSSAEALATARGNLKLERAAQATARRIAQAQADTAFLARQAAENAPEVNRLVEWMGSPRGRIYGIAGIATTVAIVGAVVVAPLAKRAWNERRQARPEAGDDVEDQPGSPV